MPPARVAAALLAVLLAGVVLATPAAAEDAPSSAPVGRSGAVHVSRPAGLPAGWRQDMLARVNAARAAVGVAPLRPCPALRRAAQGYASVMATTDTYGHQGPDGSAPWDRTRSQGYAWQAVAENIAAGQGTVAEVMTAWLASPHHYANLVDPHLRHVGFGYAADSGATYDHYWVQDFGRGRGC